MNSASRPCSGRVWRSTDPAAEVYAALWLGALLAAAGELPAPFPPPIEALARWYFEIYPPDGKA